MKIEKQTYTIMGKKYKNLIQQIGSIENLQLAYDKAKLGKQETISFLKFNENYATNMRLLSDSILDGTYTISEPRRFTLYVPKERKIVALPFADRLVQHAINNIIEPIFEKVFMPTTYACRPSKGTHAAVRYVQSEFRRNPYWLKVDFRKYFDNIDKDILMIEIKRKISCKPTLDLLIKFLDMQDQGIPVGNLTSQLFANIYGHVFDRFLTHTLRVKWFRYMDDTVIFLKSVSDVRPVLISIKEFISKALGLSLSKWFSGTGLIPWLGYRIHSKYKLLQKKELKNCINQDPSIHKKQ